MTGPTLSGGHYRLGERLDAVPWGTGAPGTGPDVRHAHDAWSDRGVLAVALPTSDGTPPRASVLPRVARDIRRAERADHPGLATALDVAVDEERGLWLIHALPTGARTLGEAAPATVLGWARTLAGALVAAHGARLAHGRIAPGVLVVDAHDHARLLAAPSGVRPDDRPDAEDADARALAAALRPALAPDAHDPDGLGARLAALLDAVAEGRTPADAAHPPALASALDAALGRLATEGVAAVTTVVATMGEQRTTVVRTPVAPTARVARPPVPVASGVRLPTSTWAAPGGPSWGGVPPTGSWPGVAPTTAHPSSRGRDRTTLVVLGILAALVLVAGVVALIVLLSRPAPTVPVPDRTTSVVDPGGRVVPAVAVTPSGDVVDTRAGDRPGGRAMSQLRPTAPHTGAPR